MIHGVSLSVVIPARGGSKGIPRKNLYRLGGVTLVERAIRCARRGAAVDAVYVSTDDPETHALAAVHGCATPTLRPSHLSTDTARTTDLIRHLVESKVLGVDGCVLLLQPTSPLRTLSDLEGVARMLAEAWETADAVVSVGAIDGPHPFKAQIIEGDYLVSLFSKESTVPRQTLPKTYIPNGAFYLVKTRVLLDSDTFVPRRSLPFVMSAMESINLDAPLDLLLLEAALKAGVARLEDFE